MSDSCSSERTSPKALARRPPWHMTASSCRHGCRLSPPERTRRRVVSLGVAYLAPDWVAERVKLGRQLQSDGKELVEQIQGFVSQDARTTGSSCLSQLYGTRLTDLQEQSPRRLCGILHASRSWLMRPNMEGQSDLLRRHKINDTSTRPSHRAIRRSDGRTGRRVAVRRRALLMAISAYHPVPSTLEWFERVEGKSLVDK